jgi:sigma-B regulation protein RsbU (phosphoserine phosphatase)
VRREELELKLNDLQKDYAELHAAIFEAAQVHRRLCAPRLIRYGDFEIANEIFAVRHLAGDFFTVRDGSNRAVLALGDISGKGLAAGMWTTHLVSLVGARAAVKSEPEVIVAGVNRDVCLTASTVPLASLFVARLDSATGMLDYCSAGHPPALLLRSNGELEALSEGGLLLGVLPTAPYVRGSVQLGPGDVLLAYSDGVLETVNNSDEEFGLERIKTQLRIAALEQNDTMSRVSAETILFSVLAAVQDFGASHKLVDDLSVVVIRRDS